jgi:N-acetylglucosaminyldiphosphoundecaprenol N-acetyl-beta-D-mannosaminyltransferase
MLNKQFLISIPISIGPYSEFVNSIISLAQNRKSSYVCVANVHMVIESYKSKTFAGYVSRADIVTPDGMPLARAIKALYGIDQGRIAGMDLLPDLLLKAEETGLGVFFYGGTQPMLDKAKEFLKVQFPNLIVSGFYSPPFRELSKQEEVDIVEKINGLNPSIVFVVLGCPKQEKWMHDMKNRVNSVMVGVGGALPVLIGMQKRAPKWMQKNSFEWLWRLMQEPRRLFKRYLITNSIFLMLYFKKLFKKVIH